MTLRAENLRLIRGGREILSDISLDIKPASVCAVIGPNGAGKSSLLTMLAGEVQPSGGRVELEGICIDQLQPKELAAKRAVMSQSIDVVFDFSVDQILEMGWVHARDWGHSIMIQVIEMCSQVCGIESLRERNYRTLSGGEQQRVQFCRAMIQIWQPETEGESRYLLLDEPTSSLDVAHELQLLNLVKQTRDTTGILIVLHDLNLAAHFADTIYLLHHGRVLARGIPEDVMTSHQLSDVYGTEIQVEERQGRPYIYTH
ncbi:MAG: heme ABC transporter ATP-binding protein [Pseudomonadales bacterium]|nr:heme ABC transporter ATP-binding protein [Pseudomonadales bacterium]